MTWTCFGCVSFVVNFYKDLISATSASLSNNLRPPLLLPSHRVIRRSFAVASCTPNMADNSSMLSAVVACVLRDLVRLNFGRLSRPSPRFEVNFLAF